jgi:hypothetical protein
VVDGDEPCGSFHRTNGVHHLTPEQVIHQRRAACSRWPTGSATSARRPRATRPPRDLVAIGSVYIGNHRGVGKVYQLTAIDTATRWAIMMIVLGPLS